MLRSATTSSHVYVWELQYQTKYRKIQTNAVFIAIDNKKTRKITIYTCIYMASRDDVTFRRRIQNFLKRQALENALNYVGEKSSDSFLRYPFILFC